MSKLVENIILSEIIGKDKDEQLAILEKLESENWMKEHRAIITNLRGKILAKKDQKEVGEEKGGGIDSEEIKDAIDSGDIMAITEVIKKVAKSTAFDGPTQQHDVFNQLAQNITGSGNVKLMILALGSCIFSSEDETVIAKAIISGGDINALEEIFKADAIDPESEAGMLLIYHMISNGDVMAMAKLLEENCCYTNDELEEKFIKTIIISGNIEAIIEALYRHYVNFKTSDRYDIYDLDGLLISAIIRLGNIDDVAKAAKKIHIKGHITTAEKILLKIIIKSGDINATKKALEHIENDTAEGRSLHAELSVLKIRKELTEITEA